MNYQIELEANDQPAIVERVLQTVRYRQFNVNTMMMRHTESDKLSISLQVSSQHSINILTSQLNKLYDLTRLTVTQDLPLRKSA